MCQVYKPKKGGDARNSSLSTIHMSFHIFPQICQFFFTFSHNNNNKIMSEHSAPILTTSQSNILNIYAQEQQISKAFQLGNFYLNERLNIQELRQRIDRQKMKQSMENTIITHLNLNKQDSKYDLSPKYRSRASTIGNEAEAGRRMTDFRYGAKKDPTPLECILNSSQITAGQQDEPSCRMGKVQSSNQSLYYQNKTLINYRPKEPTPSLTKHLKQRPPITRKTPLYRQLQVRIRSKMQKTKTQNIESRVSQWRLEGQLIIGRQEQLREYERRIMFLWEHYELLSRILQLLHGDIGKARFHIGKYRSAVCSHNFEFILQILTEMCASHHSKAQVQFSRRLSKNILSARLLQHLSIVFLALSFYSGGMARTNLNNMIGYASANLISTIKLISLGHSFTAPLKVSQVVSEKELIIESFQIASYGGKLNRISDVLIRIEQSNNVMVLIKNKLDLQRNFMKVVNAFLKPNPQKNTYLFYPHYLFQFLAFTITQKSLTGPLPQVQIAPAPYLDMSKACTLVIEPWEVLLAVKGQNVFIRAYTEVFINQLAPYCNILYWTDLLPCQIDPFMGRLPPGDILYRHHCRQENGRFIKEANRIGCEINGVLMIDRSEEGFRMDLERGVEMPWFGKKRDCRLLDALKVIMPYVERRDFGGCVQLLRESVSRGTRPQQMRERPFQVKRYPYKN